MKVLVIKEKAKSLGIRPGKMKKAELIDAIQQAEGYIRCLAIQTVNANIRTAASEGTALGTNVICVRGV